MIVITWSLRAAFLEGLHASQNFNPYCNSAIPSRQCIVPTGLNPLTLIYEFPRCHFVKIQQISSQYIHCMQIVG